MEPDLAAFLARYAPRVVEAGAWLDGALRLRITSYLGDDLPPLRYLNSVRGLVFQGDALLVPRNRHASHIVPGGRREPGEEPEATLRREVLEEAGWTLAAITILGFSHFHILDPRPPGYAYPRSGFVNVVCMADAVAFHPEAMLADDYEVEAGFRPLAEVQALDLSSGERLFLSSALERRRGGAGD